jgi:hypothetical protein
MMELTFALKSILGSLTVILFSLAYVRLRKKPARRIAADQPPAPALEPDPDARPGDADVAPAAGESEFAAYSLRELKNLIATNGGDLAGLLERREVEERLRGILAGEKQQPPPRTREAVAQAPPLIAVRAPHEPLDASSNEEHEEPDAAHPPGEDVQQRGEASTPAAVAPSMTKKQIFKAEKKKRKSEIREGWVLELERRKEDADNKKREAEERELEKREARQRLRGRQAPVQASKPVREAAAVVTDEEIFEYVSTHAPVAWGNVAKALAHCPGLPGRLERVLVENRGYVDDEGVVRLVFEGDVERLGELMQARGKVSVRDLFGALAE